MTCTAFLEVSLYSGNGPKAKLHGGIAGAPVFERLTAWHSFNKHEDQLNRYRYQVLIVNLHQLVPGSIIFLK